MGRGKSRIVYFAACAALMAGCGSNGKDEARKVAAKSVVADTRPIREHVVTDRLIAAQPAGSAQRALLQYWRDLQFQAWSQAASYYARGLRDFVGRDRLVLALEGQGDRFRSTHPSELSAEQRAGGETLVRFWLGDADRNTSPTSMSWRKENGEWRIAYDPFLDRALAEQRQLEVQRQVDPLGQRPAKAAVSAGARAGELQARYLQRTEGGRGRAPDTP